jgi:hypothetical protein
MMEVEQNPQSQAILRNEAITVLVSKLRVMLNPTYLVNSELVQVQPSAGAGQQVAGRVDDMFELEGSLSPGSDDDDSDLEPAGNPKRKKNDRGTNGKEKKARGSDQVSMKAVHMGEGVHGAAERLSGAGGMAWKHESGDTGSKSGMLAALAGLPLRQGNPLDKGNSISGVPSIHGVAHAPAHEEHRLNSEMNHGANSGGEFSIEYLSNMVRASLEKVPANVRDQVLSSVITGMHGGPQNNQVGAVSAPQHPQQPQMLQPGMHSYMKLSNIMQDGHKHQQHQQYANDIMAAKQSLQGAHMMHTMPNQLHAMPSHKPHGHVLNHQVLNQGAHQRASFRQSLGVHQDPNGLGPNATRHDESSDDEAAAAATPAPWNTPDQRVNGQMNGQMVAICPLASSSLFFLLLRV